MKALGEDGRIVVVSIDELLHQLLPPEMSARVVIPSRCTTDAHLPDVRAQCKVAHFKIKHFAMLAAIEASLASSQPFSITFSDNDCIWLRTSYLTWLDAHAADVPNGTVFVAQRGMDKRGGVFRQAGSVACIGLYTFFPTPQALELMRRLIQHILHSPRTFDDQVTFNAVAAAAGAFRFANGRLNYTSMASTAIDFTLDSSHYRIGLLNYEEFPRGISISDRGASGSGFSREWRRIWACNPQPRALVWHLQAPKNGDAKRLSMEADGVWAIGNWSGLRVQSELTAYVAKISPVTKAILPAAQCDLGQMS